MASFNDLAKFNYGRVWEETEVGPSSIDLSFVTNKCRFFLGDRWLEMGKISLRQVGKSAIVDVEMPDVEDFFSKRVDLQDGTEEWLEWGPRLN